MSNPGISLNPTENVYLVESASDLPDELSQFVLYNLQYDPGSGIGLYYSADGVSLTALATGGASGVTSFAGRVGVVSPLLADYNAFFLTPAEGAAAFEPLDPNIAKTDVAETITSPWTFSAEIQFTPQAAPAHNEGLLWYDSSSKSLSYYNEEADVTVNVGQETLVRARNSTGATITNGSVVYISGSTGASMPNIDLAQADALATSEVLGIVTHDIENNTNGYVTISGSVGGLNTSAFTAGDELFLSDSVAGGYTATVPTTGFAKVVGYVLVANPSVGQVKVLVTDPVLRGDLTSASQDEDITGDWSIVNTNPSWDFEETGATADEGNWRFEAESDVFYLRTVNDIKSVVETVFAVTRTGTTPDRTTFAGDLDVSQNLFASSLGVGDHTLDPDHILHVLDTTETAAVNEIAHFEWISPSPANNDNLDVLFSMANSLGNSIEVGRIAYQIQDITAGSEDGALIFDVVRAGALEQVIVLDTDEIIINDALSDRNFIVKYIGGDALNIRGSSGIATFSKAVEIEDTQPLLYLKETGATADEGNWRFEADGDVFYLRTVNDALSVVQTVFSVGRTGLDVDQIQFQGPLIAPNIEVMKVKSADESVISNNTPQADDHLTNFSLVAGQRYSFEVFLNATCASNIPDMAINFSFTNTPSNAVKLLRTAYGNTRASSTSTSMTAGQFAVVDNANANTIKITGFFRANVTTGGTFGLVWSQNISVASTTTVKAGSYMSVKRID